MYRPLTPAPHLYNPCINDVVSAPRTPTGTDVIVSARSYHSGGAMCGLGDGSVRFLSETIDLTVYHALGTRSGGEVVPGDW